MKIVGISGKAGTGKDFISQNFFTANGFVQFSFAWHFKVWLISTERATYEEVFVTKPEHVRTTLQDEGTKFGREVYGENIWVNTAFTWMKILSENSGITKFVIPDVRFVNEADFIKNIGGKVIRIHAPQRAENNKLTPEHRLHKSEVDLDNYTGFNLVLENDYGRSLIDHAKALEKFL